MSKKLRTCLKCNRWFESTGPAHRLCFYCRKRNLAWSRLQERQLQKQRGEKRHNREVFEL